MGKIPEWSSGLGLRSGIFRHAGVVLFFLFLVATSRGVAIGAQAQICGRRISPIDSLSVYFFHFGLHFIHIFL